MYRRYLYNSYFIIAAMVTLPGPDFHPNFSIPYKHDAELVC